MRHENFQVLQGYYDQFLLTDKPVLSHSRLKFVVIFSLIFGCRMDFLLWIVAGANSRWWKIFPQHNDFAGRSFEWPGQAECSPWKARIVFGISCSILHFKLFFCKLIMLAFQFFGCFVRSKPIKKQWTNCSWWCRIAWCVQEKFKMSKRTATMYHIDERVSWYLVMQNFRALHYWTIFLMSVLLSTVLLLGHHCWGRGFRHAWRCCDWRCRWNGIVNDHEQIIFRLPL